MRERQAAERFHPRTLLVWTWLLLSLSNCSEQSLQPAQLNLVCRADQSDRCQTWAWAGQDQVLLLLGSQLAPVFEVNLEDEVVLEAQGFRAWLGQQELVDIDFHGPAHGQASGLRATLPAGLVPGRYELILASPSGPLQELSDAFDLRSPLTAALSLEKNILPAGDLALVELSMRNLGQVTLEQVHLEWEQEGEGRVNLDGSLIFDDLIPGSQQPAQIEIEALTPGRCSLSIWLAARSADGVDLRQEPGLRAEFAILEAARLEQTVELQPNPVQAGQEFELDILARNTGGVGLTQVELLIDEVAGDALVDWEPAPDGAILLSGGQRYLRRKAVARTPGFLELQVRLQGIEDISGTLRQSEPSAPLQLDILP